MFRHCPAGTRERSMVRQMQNTDRKKKKLMPLQQMEPELQGLRKVFDSVELLDTEAVRTGALEGRCACFTQWGRKELCEVCIARQALATHAPRTKLERVGQDLYEVSARWLQVDGAEVLLELARKMDRSALLEAEDGGLLSDGQEAQYRDPLTGAYNRRYYDEILRSQNLSGGVAMLDLDNFRLSNDVYGHYAGDVMLETAVNVLRRNLSPEDRIVRYGGDELLLLLPGAGKEELDRRLEQLRLQFYAAGVPGYSRIQLSASFGGVWVRNVPADHAVKRAIHLMNDARAQKNTVIVEQRSLPDYLSENARRQSVLIVDDSEMNRRLLSEMLGPQFDTAEAASGEECLRLLEQNPTGISIVLLDIHMEGIDGFAVLEEMNRRQMLESIPVIMISSEDTVDAVRRAFDLGASDYISRPFDAKVVYQRVTNTIRLYTRQRRLRELAADQLYAKEKNSRILLGILSRVMEKRNGESRNHTQRVSQLTEILLTHLSQKTDRYPLPQETRRAISAAAELHDIGKMEIEDGILRKKGPLTRAELQTLRSHTLLGAQMMEELEGCSNEPFVRFAYQICRWHHERYDGSGYPDGLKGEDIPIAAQVVGLADVYERLTGSPMDGKACTHEEAVRMLCSGECGGFGPQLLECLQEAGQELSAVMRDGAAR